MGAAQVTDSTFQAEVLEGPLPVLVDFWAEWCGPCRMMGPVVDALGVKHGAIVKVVKLDVDSNPDISQKMNIVSIPCLVLFKNGEEVARFTGFKPQEALESDLLKHL